MSEMIHEELYSRTAPSGNNLFVLQVKENFGEISGGNHDSL
jgi:hypothetical protein